MVTFLVESEREILRDLVRAGVAQVRRQAEHTVAPINGDNEGDEVFHRKADRRSREFRGSAGPRCDGL
jgi:hypothetical protein